MPAYAIIGGQWGDEGKGKIVDFLTSDAKAVVRFSGGNNAGHTVMTDEGEFKFHLVPSGIVWPHPICVIGNGVVVDPDGLLSEIAGLQKHNIDVSRLVISDRAHVIMPYHVALDGLEEKARGKDALGTTGRGIGPAYMDKVARWGIRMGEIKDINGLKPRLDALVAQKNAHIQLYGGDPFDPSDLYERCQRWSEQLGGYIQPTEILIEDMLARGDAILLEGAQGALLDLDHGTYPYVTSSSPTVGGAITGSGVHPRHLKGIMGVFKAYTTRVGAGPMPSELDDEVGDTIRERAWEYGTTTGRPRRCGWFDAVAARYSATVNGFTSAVLTRLDVLDGISPPKVCVAYKYNGEIINRFPSSASILEHCEPVLEEFEGWDNPTASLQNMRDIPRQAKTYVRRLEDLIGCPISIISTGPKREETVLVHPVL